MALSLTQNALQINFDSVLSLSDGGMVSMFKALEEYSGKFSKGVTVNISEVQFAGIFDLPTEGLTSVNDLPANLINEGRRAFSEIGELIKPSCKKKEMKIVFRLLNDILAKAITAKAGSFDAVTQERFLLMAAIHCGIKIKWSRFLFDILKEMVTPSSKQARGFAVQLSLLLEGVPGLTLGESKALPPLKILTVKSVGTYIAKNKYVPEVSEEVKENVQDAVPIYMVSARSPTVQIRTSPKRKLILREESEEEDTDSEDTVPLSKVLKPTETSLFDEESMTIDEILKHIPEDMLLPSLSVEEPTKILFSQGVAFREVNWYKATIPKIDPTIKGKAPLVEEIKVLEANTKLRIAGNPYPEAETNGKTIKFHCKKKPATSRSSPRSFYRLNWVTIRRATHKESSATKIAQNNDGERWQSTGKELW
ncbi:hypothetical protein F511_13602 [Dorcoceras hygrometricum]|uniref:Dystroglycan-like n=1 Tax=Dorcoceras hygrometricum TaxID=472368 RepID=A0A2Z7C8K6_9LAMI|nr:hypothetical protein F511_13602 [Dorcoceras hygrometricum]